MFKDMFKDFAGMVDAEIKTAEKLKEEEKNNRAEIETFQDGTVLGTFSQIKLDDGNKILISLTQTEIAIFKVGFAGRLKGTLWKEDIYKFMDFIYPEGPASVNADKSVLRFAVDLAMQGKTINEVKEKFINLVKY